MRIKLKNISATETNPLQKHLNTIFSLPKEKKKYAEEKLNAARAARELIKKNSDTPEKISEGSDPLKAPEAKDKLTVLSSVIDKTEQVNQDNQQTISEYLSKQDKLRKENQLVYGKRKNSRDSSLSSLGLGLVENQDKSINLFYKRKLISTHGYRGDQYAIQGAVEFGITYDNKIFIVPLSEDSIANNLYKLAQGALLKAVGCIQIGNRQLEESVVDGGIYQELEGQVKYISVYNAFFDAPTDNIAVSLFALQALGVDLSDTQVVVPNANAPLISHFSGCNINICGDIKPVSYYLNVSRFPGAQALAEKNLTVIDKITELFYTIDDSILLKRNKKLIKDLHEEKDRLKLNLNKLFNCSEELTEDTEKKAKLSKAELRLQQDINQPSTSSQTRADQTIESETGIEEKPAGSFNNCWQAIKESIHFFKEKNIDLHFLVPEINIILAYILHDLKPEEKKQLEEWVPKSRGLESENISNYIKFYDQDPVKTCMVLLKDYSKGNGWQGMVHRFFSGAWNRNYKGPVNKFLLAYNNDELPDDINICGIYGQLKDSGLIFNFDSENKSSLRKILLFCAKLNNEEEALLHLINNCSFTSFPPPVDDSQINCCC